MTFVIDYALIDLMTLVYKVDHVSTTTFATCEDIDENCFRINVYPYGKLIPKEVAFAITKVVRGYLFNE